ncbi:MAG: glycosyltransferase family 39 protein [Chloroflexota bacterium]|nr:glycosyltransferase family 39 protein [Chloroflexota bacterium]
MSPTARELIRLTVLALLVRTAVALVIDRAPWTDSAYYYASARELATGHGLTVPFVWSFLETGGRLPTHPALPIPSHAHWMPLTSFVSAGAMWLLGATWRAGQVAMVLLSTLLTPLAYLIGLRIFRSRAAGVAGGVLVVFCGPLLLFGSIVENFAVFGLAGAGALYAAMRSVEDRGHRKLWLIGSGALVGIATLARVDGVLLGVATATAWAIGMGWTSWRASGPRPGWLVGVASAAAFAATVAPWAARNLATFGAVLPSTGGHTLWIKSYNEQFSLTADTSFATYLAQGPLAIMSPKVQTWITLLGYSVALLAGIFGALFLASLWLQRREPCHAPFIVYWLMMFVAMGAIFTFHAPNGLFYHHAAAWLPIAAPMSATAIGRLGNAASRWWGFLGRPATHRFILVVSLLAAVPFSLVASGLLLASWRQDLRAAAAVGRFLEQDAQPNDVVMHRDAPLFFTVTGHPTVAPPNDPFPVIEEVARAYHARWYVAQLQSIGPSLEPLGLWKGGDAVDDLGNRADWLAREPSFDDGEVRVYAILPQGQAAAGARSSTPIEDSATRW